MIATELVAKDVVVKEKFQVIKMVAVTEPAASPEYRPWVIEAMRNEPGEIDYVCSI